jgi:hypothetical protein
MQLNAIRLVLKIFFRKIYKNLLKSKVCFFILFKRLIVIILPSLSQTVGTSFEFIFPVLLTSPGFLLNETIIRVDDFQNEDCVVYAPLIANPSTGKSPGMI